jgi:hypothetical protein
MTEAGIGGIKGKDFLETHQVETTKTKSFYDGLNRLSYFIVASKTSVTGTPCLVTKYSYVGSTAQVDTSTEYITAWDTSWDLTEDTPS